MTRIKISAGILLFMLCMSIFTGVWLNSRCTDMIERSDRIGELYSQGRSEEALAEAEKLEKEWADFRKAGSLMVKNNKLAEIDRVCTRISYYAGNDSQELMPEIIELRNMLDKLREGEIPKLTTVF